ncbi:MAG: hypothetical protein KBB33_00415 [Candidatus Cloacimonetes bacterium]|jgi:RNA polymerase subunit RPABC4/transcription elongation factor Spt4|nr:hypothetical protein [Candidatus Cloacimonadota bacterium]MDD2596261.1 hypothetical protein [Candidatus Cloacimonadota bacterium]MDD4099489.1 hypothetical protein [Candidatus Cloacimonadota bacterium]MDD4805198.1 hypothetical protein [Candidatus Cloacimonadota bacterium]HOH60358.1 hypothetical protein [Candidatus Cloacimonadota bacterium]
MPKTNRGKEVKKMPNAGRGECPVCHRTGVKVIYEVKAGDKSIKVCKTCKALPAEKLTA